MSVVKIQASDSCCCCCCCCFYYRDQIYDWDFLAHNWGKKHLFLALWIPLILS